MKKLKEFLYSTRLKTPIITKYLSKYNSIAEDIMSLVNYYILRRPGRMDTDIINLNIVSSTTCNARCNFCAYKYLKDDKKIMPFSIFKKAVDEAKRMKIRNIGLTPTVGEVLLDGEFFEKVKYLEEKGIESSLFTNAILLSFNDNINKLIDSNIKNIYFDLGDIIPIYSSRIFGISEKMATNQIIGILDFLNKLDKKNIIKNITLEFRPMRPMGNILEDMKNTKFWELYKKGTFRISFLENYDNWGGQIKKKDLLGIQDLKIPSKIKIYPCKSLQSLYIMPDGDIRVCGCRIINTFKDELVIGNIKTDSLINIKESNNWKKIISKFKNGSLPKVCKECSFYRPFIQK